MRGAGCGVRGLSVFSYRGSPLPSSLFPLPTSDFPLPTSDFPLPTSDFPLPTSVSGLVTGQWALGSGRLTVRFWRIVFAFRLAALGGRCMTFNAERGLCLSASMGGRAGHCWLSAAAGELLAIEVPAAFLLFAQPSRWVV